MFAEYPRVRIVIYGLSVISTIASFFITLYAPELATAFVSTAALLTTLAGAQALSNGPVKQAVENAQEEALTD